MHQHRIECAENKSALPLRAETAALWTAFALLTPFAGEGADLAVQASPPPSAPVPAVEIALGVLPEGYHTLVVGPLLSREATSISLIRSSMEDLRSSSASGATLQQASGVVSNFFFGVRELELVSGQLCFQTRSGKPDGTELARSDLFPRFDQALAREALHQGAGSTNGSSTTLQKVRKAAEDDFPAPRHGLQLAAFEPYRGISSSIADLNFVVGSLQQRYQSTTLPQNSRVTMIGVPEFVQLATAVQQVAEDLHQQVYDATTKAQQSVVSSVKRDPALSPSSPR